MQEDTEQQANPTRSVSRSKRRLPPPVGEAGVVPYIGPPSHPGRPRRPHRPKPIRTFTPASDEKIIPPIQFILLTILGKDGMTSKELIRQYLKITGRKTRMNTMHVHLFTIKRRGWMNYWHVTHGKVHLLRTTEKGENALLRSRKFYKSLAEFSPKGQVKLQTQYDMPKSMGVPVVVTG